MPGVDEDGEPVSLTVGDNTLELAGADEDGLTITPGASDTSIAGMAPNSSLKVGEDGTYIVTGDDGDTETLNAEAGETIWSDKDGSIAIYDPANFDLTGDEALDDIADKIAGTDAAVFDSITPVDYTSDTTYNTSEPQVFNLTNNDTTGAAAEYDFSSETGEKKVTLFDGDQEVTFNDEGGNIAIVDTTATGDKTINLGDGGDNAVVGDTDANVTVNAGAGDDNIVALSDITVGTNDSGTTKVTPLNGAEITLDGYGEEEFDNGTGVQIFPKLSRITPLCLAMVLQVLAMKAQLYLMLMQKTKAQPMLTSMTEHKVTAATAIPAMYLPKLDSHTAAAAKSIWAMKLLEL